MSQDFGTPPPSSSLEEPKKNNTTTILIVIIVLVVLCFCCAILAVGYYLWTYGDYIFNLQPQSIVPFLFLG